MTAATRPLTLATRHSTLLPAMTTDTETKAKKYICVNCGYIYDPEAGDPMNDIQAGTPFENLPAEWVCPICYATQDMFDPLD